MKKSKKTSINRIQLLTDLYFKDLPYGEATAVARKRIEEKLEEEYDGKDIDSLVEKYGKLQDMAALAGYTEEDIKSWRSTETVAEPKAARRGFRYQRWRAYLSALFFSLLLGAILWTVYTLATKNIIAYFLLIYSVILTFAGGFTVYHYKRIEKLHVGEKYDTETYLWIRRHSDQYTKRLLNSVAVTFAVGTIFLAAELSFYFFGRSKRAEMIESLLNNVIFLQVPTFLLIKNTMMVRVCQNRIQKPNHKLLLKHTVGVNIASAVYWLGLLTFLLITRKNFHKPGDVILVGGIAFALGLGIYNLTLRRQVTHKNLCFNKKRIGLVLAALTIFVGYRLMSRETYYMQPYINSLPVVSHANNKIRYNDETGVYTIRTEDEGDDFKILHLTDIHLGGSIFSYRKDLKALKACYKEIAATHPDLVIVTGDLSFPLGIMSMSFDNAAPVQEFASFMRNLNIPWAFTYGNHDTENLASLDPTELNEVYKSLSYKTSGTLLYPYKQPDTTGRNNQLIEIRRANGTLNTALFLIDSNAYTGDGLNDYDYIHDDQVAWYEEEVKRMKEEEGHTVPSLCFFHIPLQEYETAYKLYQEGSPEVTFFFGENKEEGTGKVSCSSHSSTFFSKVLELKSTTGLFCGHDHYNNMSLRYKGVRLTYGMSIDYLAMPGIESKTAQRGAELITIHEDSTWDVKQIPLEELP